MTVCPVNGIELNVAVQGQGPAVLLLHGWPHTWQLWNALIPALATRHRVIAPDSGGTPSDRPSLPRCADAQPERARRALPLCRRCGSRGGN